MKLQQVLEDYNNQNYSFRPKSITLLSYHEKLVDLFAWSS